MSTDFNPQHQNIDNVRADKVFTLTRPPGFDYGPRQKRYSPTVEVRTTPKVGRNEPCPCGSGLKNKKCCKK